MFGTKDLLTLISEIGLIPTLLLMSLALFFIFKENKKTMTGLGVSIEKLKESTSSSIEKLKEEIKSQHQRHSERMDKIEETISTSIDNLHQKTEENFRQFRAEIEDRDRRQDARMDAIEKELKFIGREYVSKEQHFNDTEGWKANLDNLRRDLSEIPLKMITVMKEIKQ